MCVEGTKTVDWCVGLCVCVCVEGTKTLDWCVGLCVCVLRGQRLSTGV